MKILLLGGAGYIGSALYQFLRSKDHTVDAIDRHWFGRVGGTYGDYALLGKEFIQSHDVVILLAGHSSVAMCDNDVYGSFDNNVNKFISLLGKLSKDQKFIYASSASVYGQSDVCKPWKESMALAPPICPYDLSKQVIDYYAALSGLDYYGLRFGTVCGWSPNLRLDLIINSMMLSVRKYGYIKVSNESAFRAVLSMQDLCETIETISSSSRSHPGYYNVSSFNATIGHIADRVASASRCYDIRHQPSSLTYSFCLDNHKIYRNFGCELARGVEDIVQDLDKVDFDAILDIDSFKRIRVDY
jgi:UDP-glucose 4-epimerase